MAINPLLAMTQPTTAQAQPAGAAGAPGFWENFMQGTQDTLNDPTKMALMMAGLSLLSGQTPIQAGSAGAGIYQQLMQQQKADVAAEDKASMDAAQFGLQKRQVEQGDERLQLERDKMKSAEKIAGIKAAADKPSGANDKLWKQALDTAAAELEPGDSVDSFRVYEIYNSMAGNGQTVYPTFGKAELDYFLEQMSNNPDKADGLQEIITRSYGPRAAMRTKSAFDKMSKTTPTPKEEVVPPEVTTQVEQVKAQPTQTQFFGEGNKNLPFWLR